MKVQSIVKYIPTEEKNDDQFTGIVSLAKSNLGGYGGRCASIRAKQIDQQKKDAEDRNVAWSIEDKLTDTDADGESDPDYMHVDSGFLGKRQPDGNIIPMQESDCAMEGNESEVQFFGQEEVAPSHVGKLVRMSHPLVLNIIDLSKDGITLKE